MILGWFQLDSIVKCAVASIVAIAALLGLFSQRFIDWFNHWYDGLLESYKIGVGRMVNRTKLVLILCVAAIGLLIFLMGNTPTALVPNEDTGTLMGVVTLPPAPLKTVLKW